MLTWSFLHVEWCCVHLLFVKKEWSSIEKPSGVGVCVWVGGVINLLLVLNYGWVLFVIASTCLPFGGESR